MKFIAKASAVLASVGLLAAASAQEPVKFNVPGVTQPAAQPAAPAAKPTTPAPAPAVTPAAAPATTAAAPAPAPAAPVRKYTDAQVAEAYGWIVGQQVGLRQLEFTKAEVEAIGRGMVAMASGAQPTFDPQAMEAELQAYMGKKAEAFETKRQAFLQQLKIKNITEGTAFFTKLKENKAVVELPSGLRYEILKPATGAAAKPGQIATIHYTGSLITGEVFDSTVQAGAQPVDLPVKAATPSDPNGIISGMFEGLQKIGVGAKAKLYIPPSLAYGDAGSPGGIPPAATLVFEVEVVAVKDAPKEAPAAK